MAGQIPGSGSISMGPAAGDTRSMYRMRTIKRSTSDTSEQTMSSLRDWFRVYVNTAGDADGVFPNTGDQISFSQFRGLKLWGCSIQLMNEAVSTYSDLDNADIRIKGLTNAGGSQQLTFYVPAGINPSWKTPSPYNTFVTWNGVEDSVELSSHLFYDIKIKDIGGTDTQFQIRWQPGHGTAGDSFFTGFDYTDDPIYTAAWAAGTTRTIHWSHNHYFFVEDEDPAGQAYGDAGY